MKNRQQSEEIVSRMEDMLNRTYGIDTAEAWEQLYGRVFSEKGSRAFHSMNSSFSYYDPDTSYQEDATAFIHAARTFLDSRSDIDEDGYFD